MRDTVLSLVVGVLLLLTFRHPVVGAYLYAWISLMNPHKLTYGFAFDLPFAQMAALATLLALALTRRRQAVPLTGIVIVQLLLLTWMSVTCLSAYAPADRVLERWVFVMKIHVMLFVTWMLVLDAKQLRALIWVVTMSVAFFGVKGGIWTLMTGGGGRVWGPPGGMLSGNNELAVGLVMLVPVLYFLRQTASTRWVRLGLLSAMIACGFSILGSQSRGALVAIGAMAFFLGLKGKHPIRTSIGLAVLAMLAIGFMPDTWTQRMETIKTYDADSSAMSRLWTWTTLWNAALAHPLTGVGFQADNQAVFIKFAPIDGHWAVYAGKVFVAHSIYFQLLGEHGFVGFGLFILLGVTTWISAGRAARTALRHPDLADWMPLLMRMIQVSLIGYAAGGAFLSIGYLDLPYYIMGFVVICQAILRRRENQAKVQAPLPAQASAASGGFGPVSGLGIK